MTISEWNPSKAQQLAQAWNTRAAETPYEYPYEMQRHGCRHAILDVDPRNLPGLTLYVSMGYRTWLQVAQMVRGTSR